MARTIIVGLLLVHLPIGGSETVQGDYLVALGGTGVGALVLCLGNPEQQICEDHGVQPIGGYDITPANRSSGYTDLVVTLQDDNFHHPYTNVCVYAGDHNVCDLDPDDPEYDGDVQEAGCGSVALTDIETIHRVVGFVYAYHVDPDTHETCFGSSGFAKGVYGWM